MPPSSFSTSVPSDPALPGVSVVLPVRDEERHLRAAVDRVLAQSYAGPYEVVLAIGPSADRTHEIADEIASSDSRVTVVDNPSGRTPAALNLAVAAASHDILVRVDGHSEIDRDYVAQAVRTLQETGAANVGGMMAPVGVTPFEKAVARAMSSRLGVGSASFHTGGQPGPAPTVYLGVFRRAALARVGGFDERFVRAQDWELNHRLRKAGEVVWFDPSLVVTYRPRGSWRALAQQFFRTGQWRRQVIRTYPETAGLRYLAPPVALLGVASGVILTALGAATGPRWLLFGAVVPALYGAFVVSGSVGVSRGIGGRARLLLPGVVSAMHMAWGLGFLRGVAGEDARVARERHYPGPAREHAVPVAPDRPATED